MVDQRSNMTRYTNESLALWNSTSDPLLDLSNTTQLNGTTDGLQSVEDWSDVEQIRPIHIATTVMFLSGIFNVSVFLLYSLLIDHFGVDFTGHISCRLSIMLSVGASNVWLCGWWLCPRVLFPDRRSAWH